MRDALRAYLRFASADRRPSSLLTTSPDFGPFASVGPVWPELCGLCRLRVAHFVGPFLKEWAVLLQVVGISAMSCFGGKATANARVVAVVGERFNVLVEPAGRTRSLRTIRIRLD